MKKMTMWALFSRDFVRPQQRPDEQHADAPVVPMKLAITAPRASRPVLASGVPFSEPRT